MQEGLLTLNSDGGARGNPGPAACGFTAKVNGKIVGQGSKFLGVATNNVAEYQGVILALEWLTNFLKEDLQISEVTYYLDSELVVKQLNGVYKIKDKKLITLNLIIRKLIGRIKTPIYFKHILRGQNKHADLLVNQELDKHFSNSG